MHILIVHFCTDEKSKSVYNTSMRKVTHTIYVYELDPLYLLGEETQAALSYATSKMEYHGNVIYSDGKVDMVLFPGGYATINGSAVTFHYYTQDYLGTHPTVPVSAHLLSGTRPHRTADDRLPLLKDGGKQPFRQPPVNRKSIP